MRSEPHPITGFLYEELGDGLVKVTSNDDRYGVFRIDGSWVEGKLTHADPHLLIYVGGDNLPDGRDVWWERMGVGDPEAAARAYAGEDYITDRQKSAGMAQPQRVVARYVGDTGRETPAGPRSTGWVEKEQLLIAETRPELLPPVYRADSPMTGGPKRVATDRYVKKEYHDLEVDKIWKRAWQMACRADEIPEVGDYYVYEVAHLSFLVVRTAPTEFKAYYNACLHRGRLLREFSGKKATEFRCPYHGWSWKIDGSLKEMTCEWDFGPEVRNDVAQLPEAKVGTWAGFVFINPDLNAQPLEEFLGAEMMENYAKFEMETRYTQVHVAKVMAANWKVTMEAFMEAYHIIATHPQLMLGGGDGSITHYDVFGNWARAGFSGGGSPQRGIYVDPEKLIEQRKMSANSMRDYLRTVIGDKVDIFSDTEMLDTNFNDLFPNIHPWGGWSRIVFRFRPIGDDPDTCLMDVYYIAPWPEGQPKPPVPPVRHLRIEESWCAAPQLGSLARIIDQDCYNMPKVQLGLKTKSQSYVWNSGYQEGKIRNFHRNYDRWMAAD